MDEKNEKIVNIMKMLKNLKNRCSELSNGGTKMMSNLNQEVQKY